MPIFSRFTQDLTQAAREGKLQPCFGCEPMFPLVLEKLSHGAPHWVVVTGPPGAGKTRFVEGLAWTCAKALPGTTLNHLSFLRLDLQLFAANPTESEAGLKELLGVLEQAPHIVLVIDDAGPLLGIAPAPPGLRAVLSTLNPLVRRAEIRSITCLQDREYASLASLPVHAPEQTYTVRLGPWDRDRRLALLSAYGPLLEQKHRVAIDPAALHAAATLPKQFMADGQRPPVVMEALDRACQRYNHKAATAEEHPEWLKGTSLKHLGNAVSAYDVVRTIEEAGGGDLQGALLSAKNSLAAKLNQQFPNQRDAVFHFVNRVVDYRFGLTSPWLPAGLFVLWGEADVPVAAFGEALAQAAIGVPELVFPQDLRNFRDAEHAMVMLRAANRPPRLAGLLLLHAEHAADEVAAAIGRAIGVEVPTTQTSALRHRIIALAVEVPPDAASEGALKSAFASAYGPRFAGRVDAWIRINR